MGQKDIKKEIRKCFELNESENTSTWNSIKAEYRGKFIAQNSYIRNEEWTQLNDLRINLMKQSKQKKVIKIKLEISYKEKRKTESLKSKACSLRASIKLINL